MGKKNAWIFKKWGRGSIKKEESSNPVPGKMLKQPKDYLND